MGKHTVVRIKGSVWEAIAQRASHEQASPEEWLNHRVAEALEADTARTAESEVVLDLAIRHFREAFLSPEEARELAAAILHTAATGEASSVGPIGYPERCYEFNRRVAAINIRIGEGRIRLPLDAAMRLANALETSDVRLIGGIAA